MRIREKDMRMDYFSDGEAQRQKSSCVPFLHTYTLKGTHMLRLLLPHLVPFRVSPKVTTAVFHTSVHHPYARVG